MPEWSPRNTARARSLRNAATPAERLLWRYLARGQLGARFSRQMPVGPYFADFLCRSARLVVELDGFSHDLRPEADAARDRWMQAEGWRVLRFANAEVMGNIEGVVAAIRLALEEALDRREAKEEPTPNRCGFATPAAPRKREGDQVERARARRRLTHWHPLPPAGGARDLRTQSGR